MELLTIAGKLLMGLATLAVSIMFLLPVVLILWELFWGHQIKLSFLVRGLHRFTLRTFFYAMSLYCILLGIWILAPEIAMGFTICLVCGGPFVYLAYQEIRGKRTAAREFVMQKNKHRIQIPQTVSISGQDSAIKTSPESGKKKKKHPTYEHRKIGLGPYGHWT